MILLLKGTIKDPVMHFEIKKLESQPKENVLASQKRWFLHDA